jgi:L-malate glycosyltransferase
MGMIHALPFEESTTALAEKSALPHVLLVVDQFPKTLGGGERVLLKLAALLPQYGFRASILTFFVHPECVGVTPSLCPIYLLPLKRTYDLTALRGAFALRKFLREQQVLIVQTFFESSDLWAGFVTKTMPHRKLIWSRRDMGILRDRKHHIAYRWMAGIPDAVFAVSEQVRRHAIEVDGIDPQRVETVYSGLDLAQWTPDAAPARDPVEDGISGRIVPTEDAPALAAALADLLADPARARAMGDAGRDIAAKKFTTEAMMNHIAGVYRRLLAQ